MIEFAHQNLQWNFFLRQVAIYGRLPSGQHQMRFDLIDVLIFLHLSTCIVSDMPRISYENEYPTFILNTALNHGEQEFDSALSLTTAFALNSATQQPRRRAETLPWSHQMSTLKLGSQQNSLKLKPFPKSLPIPHFVQLEHDGDMKMAWQDGIG